MLAFVDCPRTAIVVTSARPIISAEAVAAVRRGLRWRSPWPAGPPCRTAGGMTAAMTRDDRPADHRAQQGDPDEHGQHAAADAATPPSRDLGEAARGHQPRAGHGEQRAPRAGAGHRGFGEDHVVAHGGDRRHPGRPAGRQIGGDQRDDHADGVGDEHGPRLEDEPAPPRSSPKAREQRLSSPAASAEPEHQPEWSTRRGRPTSASSSTDRVTWRRRGAQRPEQRQLAGALGDQDRERVEDEEAARRPGRPPAKTSRNVVMNAERLRDRSCALVGQLVRPSSPRRQRAGSRRPGRAVVRLTSASSAVGDRDVVVDVLAAEQQLLRRRGVEQSERGTGQVVAAAEPGRADHRGA